jgi:glycosyl hydrolase family 114
MCGTDDAERVFEHRLGWEHPVGRDHPFIAAGKAVFHVEYAVPNGEFCAGSRRLKLSSMRKKLELGVWRRPC